MKNLRKHYAKERLNSSILHPVVPGVEELQPRGLLPQVEGVLGGVEQLLAGEGVAAGAGDAPAQPPLAPPAALQLVLCIALSVPQQIISNC